MSKHPRIQHRDHHLSVRQTLWKTYIICDECGVEYETTWNMLYQRFGYRIHGLLGFLFVWLLLLLGGIPTASTWWVGLIYIATYSLHRAGTHCLEYLASLPPAPLR